MSRLSPLLEIQEIDVLCDAARRRSETLPEREAVPRIAAELAEIEARLEATRAERATKQSEEEGLDREVTELAHEIEAAEIARYSGPRKNPDEAAAHAESQQRLRERQESLEEREMSLLEEIETIEERIRELEAGAAGKRAESARLAEAIRKVESEMAAELGRHAEARTAILGRVPEPVLVAYERVRAQPQKGGRGAATLEKGQCGGCRIKLPSLENTRMLAEPEDALIQCPQCRRVLVR
jgi:predicted  nucleic acid-binding Zn-ribbon protein